LRDTRTYSWNTGAGGLGWTRGGSEITLGVGTSVDGFPMSLLKEDSSTGQHFLKYDNGGDFVAAGASRTISIVAKSAGRTKFYLGTYADPTYMALVDLVAKTITDGGGFYSNETIVELPDGSFRISATAISWGSPAVFLHNGSSASYAGDGASGILFGEFQINAGTKTTKYQPVNQPNNYDYIGYPKCAKHDGVDDTLYAPGLVYYPAFTSIQTAAYFGFDPTLDILIFGSLTPGNGFVMGRKQDRARFNYIVDTNEYQEVLDTAVLGEPEVLTQGYGSGKRIYRLDNAPIESVVDNFNASWNPTYPMRIAYSPFTTLYKAYANIEWSGGVYISRELTVAEQDKTVAFLNQQAGIA
jgi:hypothetical protein